MRKPAVLLATIALLLTACGSSDSSGEGSVGGSAGDLCAQLQETADDQVSIDEDPDAAAEAAVQLRELASSAPGEVAEALEVFANLVEVLAEAEADSEVDPDDPEAGMDAFGEAMALMFDPEVLAAAAVLEEYLVDECGLDPDEAEEMFGTGGLEGSDGESGLSIPEGDDDFPDGGSDGDEFGAGDAGDPSDISLDDMDEVQEANSGSSWSEKNYSTTISNDQYIVIATDVSTDGFSGDEALEACDAIRTAFEDRQPDLEVEVRSGETVMATGVAGEPCAAS